MSMESEGNIRKGGPLDNVLGMTEKDPVKFLDDCLDVFKSVQGVNATEKAILIELALRLH